ncbi:MAG: tetratricopeptide repeat protein [Rhodocyclales bacterium]|nr:tetratricopeptide repeat protein [Rhodocyclales bacterium]
MKKRIKPRKTAGKRPERILDPELMALMQLVVACRYAEVEHAARKILGQRPNQPLALKALSFALIGLGRFEDALPVLEFAVSRHAGDPELQNNLGIVLHSQLRWDEAEACFKRALALEPKDYEIWKNLGLACFKQHRWDEAIQHLLKAIEYHPEDYVEAIGHLAEALASVYRLDEALVCLRELHNNDPDNSQLLCQLLSVSLRNCDWDEFVERQERLRSLSRDFVDAVGNPFNPLALSGISGEEHRRIAANFVTLSLPENILAQTPLAARRLTGFETRRLKLGYLSADFRQHAVGLVVAEVLEMHDRSRFEVFGYSIAVDDGSALRSRLIKAFDHFIDVAAMSVYETAQRIAADEIDILIDITGWTSDGRPEALALRCAPVQANWLGYAGTLGHPRLADYLIGDATATPPEHASHFTESLALMPNCYLPADATRAVGPPPARAQAGLPESGFVFCSFNNSYKFNPTVWDLWCGILDRAPGSILWLSSPSPTAQTNLRREAQARGIDPERIIFAMRTDTQAEHLARLQLADLALDPFPYNSHSTGIDTLWAGVPLVTLRGETFAARVGESLLRAAGLSELVALTPEDYAATALQLYQDKARLATLRKSLVEGRASLPLFDMRAFARDLESLYCRMWQNELDGIREPIVSASAVTAR